MKKFLILILLSLFTLFGYGQPYLISTYNGQTVTTCSGTFYDSGGSAGDYGNNENDTVTFCSSNGQFIAIDFSLISLSNGDILYIYYGTNVDGTPNATYTNTPGINPAIITSSCQCITSHLKLIIISLLLNAV